jgi:hypothetical protein
MRLLNKKYSKLKLLFCISILNLFSTSTTAQNQHCICNIAIKVENYNAFQDQFKTYQKQKSVCAADFFHQTALL